MKLTLALLALTLFTAGSLFAQASKQVLRDRNDYEPVSATRIDQNDYEPDVIVADEVFCKSIYVDFTYSVYSNRLILRQSASTNNYQVTWIFGDGDATSAADLTATHLYRTAGIYNVCMLVETDCGLVTVCKAIVIRNTHKPRDNDGL